MKHLHYNPGATLFKHAILIKEDHFQGNHLDNFYVEPLVEKGVKKHEIILISFDSYGKRLSAATAHAELERLGPILTNLGVENVLVADASYYKFIMKTAKTAQKHGIIEKGVFPSWENFNICLSVNYMAIKHNANVTNQLNHSVSEFAKWIGHGKSLFQKKIIHYSQYPRKVHDIAAILHELNSFEELTCDIETFDLRFNKARLGTIAFAWTKHEGIAFDIAHSRNNPVETDQIYDLLRKFFTNYPGKLWFHNALFDVKILIYEIFMSGNYDMRQMHAGLDAFATCQDTMLYTYLATNTVGNNPLGLKENSYEFTGSYAIEDINDITKIDLPELLEYNLIDCLATWHVREKYEPILVADNQLNLYNQIFQPSLQILIKMMLIGLPVDPHKVDLAEAELQNIMSGYLKTITQSPLYAAINFNLRLIEQEKANAKLKKKFKTLRDFSSTIFNPGSDTQKQYVLYDMLGLEPIDYTDSGQPAVGKKTLKRLLARLKTDHQLTDDDFK